MICPQCRFEQQAGLSECLKCGVVFAKLHAASSATGESHHPFQAAAASGPRVPTWHKLLLPTPDDVNPVLWAGKVLLLIALAVWGARFMLAPLETNFAGQSCMHLVNLPFHEAGHIIFSPLGTLIKALGGTLGQLIMPAVCWGVFLFRTRDAFGAAVAQWWLAESFIDIAPYINDARALDLVLLGGVTGKDVVDYHDWEFILRKLGLLRFDHLLAHLAQFIGIGLMLLALCWAGFHLWIQFKICLSGNRSPEK